MSGSSQYMRRHSSSGVTGRRHSSTRMSRGQKQRRDMVAMSHPSASRSTSQLQPSQLIRFQSDQMTGNYPQCIMDPLPHNSATFVNLQTDGRQRTLNPKRCVTGRKRERATSTSGSGLTSENRSGLPWSEIMYDKRGRRRCAQVVHGLASGALKLEDLADFGLTPVTEVSGVSAAGLRDQSHYHGDQLLSSSGAERIPYKQESQFMQLQNAAVVPSQLEETGENVDSNAMHRYSTPLPPYTLQYLNRPNYYTSQQYGGFQRMQPQMVRINSKASSGINSVATNQSLRTYYTNHNDIAHSISSISFNSSFSFVPTEDNNRNSVAPSSRGIRFHAVGHQPAEPALQNIATGRHYSSDSELDSHVLVPGVMPGSRKSMSRALNLHPIEMDMPIASSGRAGVANSGQNEETNNMESNPEENPLQNSERPTAPTSLATQLNKQPKFDLANSNNSTDATKRQKRQQELDHQQWV